MQPEPYQHRILVVEDDESIRIILKKILTKHYTVIEAVDGEEAIRYLMEEAPPDLMLLDILMPKMNGYEVFAEIKKVPRLSSLPVIFVTALYQNVEELKGLELGAVDYITKPFNEKTLRVRIESVLELNPNLYRQIETLPEPASEFLDPEFDDEPNQSLTSETQDRQPVIITVDDDENTRDLIAEGLKQRYVIVQCQQAESLFAHIESNETPDMILLDVKLPDMDGFDVIARLKADPKTATIPVIFITAANSNEDEIRGFQAGCVDYVRKPISLPVLKARIHNQLTLDRRRKRFEDRMARYLDSDDDAQTG